MNFPFHDIKYFEIADSQNLEIPSLGEEGVLVLVKTEDFDQKSELLIKILKAISVEINSNGSIIQVDPSRNIDLNTIYSKLKFKHLIVFGIHPKRMSLQMNLTKNRWFPSETYRFLITDTLVTLDDDKAKKITLWNTLKAEFNQA